jgi:RsiW-degrading membrane proteinase PrsW (M82 family)
MSSPALPPTPWPARASDGLPVVPSPGELATTVNHAPPPTKPRRRLRQVLLMVAGVTFLAACALTILIVIGFETGRTGFVLGALLATLPVPLLIAAFRWLDRYEPEPPRVLLLAFVWGAAVATLAALTLNTVGAMTFFDGPDEALNQAAVYIAPPVEEFAKGLLLVLLAWRRRLDGVLDGIVLAGMVGVGFAFTENILYYGRAYAEADDTGTGIVLSVVVFIVRGIVSPFAHPLFTLPIGIALGLGVRSRRRSLVVTLTILGYGLAMLLHGTWNGIAVRAAEELDPGLLLTGYAGVMVPTFAAAIALAIWVRRREGRVLARRLPPFAEAGWIAPHEVAILSSLRLRRLALDLARRVGGDEARRATYAYQRQVIALGFLRERLSTGRRLPEGLAQQVEMLAALPGLRARAIVPLPPPPPRPGMLAR